VIIEVNKGGNSDTNSTISEVNMRGLK